MLDIEGVTKGFGGLIAIDDVDFTIGEQELVGLIGPNGAGKTTLFNVITGIYQPDAGHVRFRDTDITGMGRHEICRQGLVRTFQEVRSFNHMTVLENVTVGTLFGRDASLSRSDGEEIAREMIDFVGLEEVGDETVANLTVAERKQVELARGLATNPALIMIDEIGSGLNPTELAELSETITSIRDELEITVFWIEHVMEAILNNTERIIVLDDGKILTDGTPDEIKQDQRVIDAYLGSEPE